MNAAEYRAAVESLPYGKRLPTAVYLQVECAARLYGDPREADLIKIHLWSRKLTFQYYRDFDIALLPELATRIKIDLKRLFITVIDHSTGPAHQLLFFKERFPAKDHPGRDKMEAFGRRLQRLGLCPETIGYGPSKEDFEAEIQRLGLTKDLRRRACHQGSAMNEDTGSLKNARMDE